MKICNFLLSLQECVGVYTTLEVYTANCVSVYEIESEKHYFDSERLQDIQKKKCRNHQAIKGPRSVCR